jgi:hypothetical protein
VGYIVQTSAKSNSGRSSDPMQPANHTQRTFKKPDQGDPIEISVFDQKISDFPFAKQNKNDDGESPAISNDPPRSLFLRFASRKDDVLNICV